jgi:5'-phosphate synthase pdxT subunit
MKIGVLALQGAFAEHIKTLTELSFEAVPIRLPSDLDGIRALIIPGGESTTIGKLLSDYCLREPLKNLIQQGLPVMGTCAGMILLATNVVDSELEPLRVIDIEVKRNAFGRQVDSFESDLIIPALGEKPFRGIFIRAPVVEKVEPGVEILCQVDTRVVAVRQGNKLASAFHPELTSDLRFHRYFLSFIEGEAGAKGNC